MGAVSKVHRLVTVTSVCTVVREGPPREGRPYPNRAATLERGWPQKAQKERSLEKADSRNGLQHSGKPVRL